MRAMRYLSTFSGIEAASVAWEPLGWEPVGFSEINPFAAAVLAHRFPKVTNFGDVTRYETWKIGGGAVDLLVGGSPCQSFSVAGRREGLNDPRGQLMLSYLGVARRFRPRWVVWENVPGVLSSGGGRDFGSLVGGLAKLGYGVAYRVLDAQWCRVDGYEKAVPQRRRRVFLVGCLGDARLASKVLFESQSVRRDPSSGREEGQGDTRFAQDGIGASVSENMIATPEIGLFSDGLHAVLDGRATASGNADSSGRTNVMAKEKPSVIDRSAFNQGSNALYAPSIEESDVMATLVAKGPHAVYDVAGTMGSRTGSGGGFSTDFEVSGGLIPITALTDACGQVARLSVRRLTPRECERLQGFPDDWTLVPYRNKPAADGPRCKVIGNSMAVNCMRWIGRRIQANL